MSEPSITKIAGEELPASELNQLIIEALNDYRDFTLGENISANLPVYLKASDSKIYKTTSAADDEKIHSFVGILKEAGSTNDVKKVQVSGKVIGLSGLTAGQKVYLKDTAGNYGTIGTYEKQIGIAISTTSIILRTQTEGGLTVKDQTITGVKTFGSIPLGPNSDPTQNNELVRKKYLNDQDGLRALANPLGSWASANDDGNAHQVSTDGFLVVSIQGDSSYFTIYTDSSNPPTTVRAIAMIGMSGVRTPATVPVRKGDYYQITKGGAGVVSYWIPLGT